jgi:hypothetical protein
MFLRSAALLLMLSSCVAQRSVMPEALVPPPSMREGLVAMFADCVSAGGPTRELPLVEGGSTAFEDLGVQSPPLLRELARISTGCLTGRLRGPA